MQLTQVKEWPHFLYHSNHLVILELNNIGFKSTFKVCLLKCISFNEFCFVQIL